jgi:DNA-binding MarR family transcriptional regulator
MPPHFGQKIERGGGCRQTALSCNMSGENQRSLNEITKEDLSMAVNPEQENTLLRLWLLLPRVGDALALCQDSVFSKYGITTEQWRVLMAIKARGPLRPVDIASLLERAPNSMSMLVDRMVKAGLVRRTRDRKDRRAVFVTMTDKGKKAVEPAFPAGWEFFHKLLSPLSYDEQRALANMLETMKCQLTSYLNPEMDMADIVKNSFTNDPHLYKRLVKNVLSADHEAKHEARGKRKTVRRR